MLSLGRAALRWTEVNCWTDVYGTARSLLALGTLGTFVFTDAAHLFVPAVGVPDVPVCRGLSTVGLFCVFDESLELARWIGVVILLTVASGWRPRLTGLPHWWVSFSFMTSTPLVDGGDQLAAILTLLLVPITLTDPRRWHWDPPVERGGRYELHRRIIARSSFVVIRIQVAVVYLHAAVGKLTVEEWRDGTAVYYWFTDPAFGVPGWLNSPVLHLLTSAWGVTLLTWGTIVLELFLFAGLLMKRSFKPYFLVAGIAFHGAIAVLHGLVSFAFTMWGALIIYLRPVEGRLGLASRFRSWYGPLSRRWRTHPA